MKYQAPYGASDIEASYVNGNPSTGVQGSIPPASAFEYPMREIVALITGAGVNPDDSNLAQVLLAIQYLIQRDAPNFALDTGSANTIVLALTPATPNLTDGLKVRARIAASCTGATTLNLDGHGAIAVVHRDGTALAANDVLINQIGEFIYNAALGEWQLSGAITGFSGPAGPAGATGPTGASGGVVHGIELISACTQQFANGIVTQVIDWATENSHLGDSSFTAGVLTVGTTSAGVWELSAQLWPNYILPCDYTVAIRKNGTNITLQGIQAAGVSGALVDVSTTVVLAAGDVIDVTFLQSIGGPPLMTFHAPTRFTCERLGSPT